MTHFTRCADCKQANDDLTAFHYTKLTGPATKYLCKRCLPAANAFALRKMLDSNTKPEQEQEQSLPTVVAQLKFGDKVTIFSDGRTGIVESLRHYYDPKTGTRVAFELDGHAYDFDSGRSVKKIITTR